jgi:hypothetical protein
MFVALLSVRITCPEIGFRAHLPGVGCHCVVAHSQDDVTRLNNYS